MVKSQPARLYIALISFTITLPNIAHSSCAGTKYFIPHCESNGILLDDAIKGHEEQKIRQMINVGGMERFYFSLPYMGQIVQHFFLRK